MQNKIVFISGASSGIGEACAKLFASHGANIILNSRNLAKLTSLKSELESKYNIQVLTLALDRKSVV